MSEALTVTVSADPVNPPIVAVTVVPLVSTIFGNDDFTSFAVLLGDVNDNGRHTLCAVSTAAMVAVPLVAPFVTHAILTYCTLLISDDAPHRPTIPAPPSVPVPRVLFACCIYHR